MAAAAVPKDPAVEAAPEPLAGLMEGRIVHYVCSDRSCRAAIVARVPWARGSEVTIGTDEEGKPITRSTWTLPDAGYVTLAVFTDPSMDGPLFYQGHGGGMVHANAVAYHPATEYREDNEIGTWHWPERA